MSLNIRYGGSNGKKEEKSFEHCCRNYGHDKYVLAEVKAMLIAAIFHCAFKWFNLTPNFHLSEGRSL